MTDLELHQKIEQQISQLPPEQLSFVSDFLDSIQAKSTVNQPPLRRISPVKRGNKAGDLLRYAGTWHGDDLEDCLRLVIEPIRPGSLLSLLTTLVDITDDFPSVDEGLL
ncbi:hypothetical protein [Cylindrospermum sp. FACHB-282]|uniref:hypothetical protein n=1 Tax=Cylindrospermum sp. FACHB-282 TaxID=2692794 RepID=UPI001F55998A|nr:hypothetical protein [Cylindrospermum sp. FACHB-282]